MDGLVIVLSHRSFLNLDNDWFTYSFPVRLLFSMNTEILAVDFIAFNLSLVVYSTVKKCLKYQKMKFEFLP